ncbi:MAG TPA: hypothetical protein VIU63_00315 [Nitrospira sp.]
MKQWLLTTLALVGATAYMPFTVSFAQTVPGAVSPQLQNQSSSPVTISPIQPSSAPTSGLPANILTPSTTNQLAPGTGPRPGATIFNSAGQGLPGMSGGPPLNLPMGAQDPSSSYMSPTTVGPLLCDPAVNISC